MAIYIFNLLVGYLPNGVDNAQGYRHPFLEKTNQKVWYVFSDFPSFKEINYYSKTGIPIDRMISPYHFFADNRTMENRVTADWLLLRFQKIWNNLQFEDTGTSKRLLQNGRRVAEIYLYSNTDKVSHVSYYKNECLVKKEVYTDALLYTDYFITAKSEKELYAKCVRRTFYTANGVAAYDILFDGNKQYFLFPDGRCCTYTQFLELFIQRLHFTEQDRIIIDRCAMLNFVQPLFENSQKAKKIVVFHSGHYFERNQSNFALYLNYEYYYIFMHMDEIHTIIVSTEQQKAELIDTILRYNCSMPQIEVIPAGALDALTYTELSRRPFSLISVSRLDQNKRVDWLIKSVIKAHEVSPKITLDVYGTGNQKYKAVLEKLISDNRAENYIHLMGYQNVKDLYKQYQVYISVSIWETLGLTLMEAAGSGNALIGLDVKYGNQVFIKPSENGYLVDFTYDNVEKNTDELIEKISDKIIEIFSDMERLERFSLKSYEIAQQFLKKDMYAKWKRVLE